MVDRTEQRNPVEVLAEEFIERRRRGDRPTVNQYADTHPELADEIRRLFPAIVAMERVKKRAPSSGGRPVELRVERLEQLGDYRIVREIGRGGMGIVYEAEQQSLGRRVAVKVFPRQALGDSKHLRRFRREARTAALLHHTNIVQVFGVGEQDGLSYYVMQLIQGIGLDKVIGQLKGSPSDPHEAVPDAAAPARVVQSGAGERSRAFTATAAAWGLVNGRFAAPDASGDETTSALTVDLGEMESSRTGTSGVVEVVGSRGQDCPPRGDCRDAIVSAEDQRLSRPTRSERSYWQSVARIGVQVGEALRYAHAQGTLHRDVKPGNLLLDAQGTVWVTDFGLAKAVAQEELSQSGDVVGTLRYMAPEQLKGKYDSRSDVYSLGLTLYELLVLRPAHADSDRNRLIQRVSEASPAPPRKLRPAIPRDLETIVLKAIARNPQHRYPTAGALVDDLQRFVDDRPIRARRVGPAERLWRFSRRNPAIASLSSVLLLVVLASFAAISWKWREAEIEKQRAQDENYRAETNLSLALDSMDQILERFASTWMAHPTAPESEDGEVDAQFRMVVSDSTAAILQDALKFYDQFAGQNAENPRLQRDTAVAHRRVGDIHERLGQYGEAESAYRRAVEILEEQSRQFPRDADLAALTAATLNELGLVLKTVGRYEDARDHFDRARQILSEELERSPQWPQCRYELARTHSNLGGVLWRLREREAGAQSHRRAIDLLEELAKKPAEKVEYRLALARAYRGYYPFAAYGKRGGDTAWFRSEAISILDQLVKDFPRVPDYQCELSETLATTRSRSRKPEDLPELEPQLRRAVDLARRIRDEYPAIPRYRAALGRSLQGLGSLLRRTMRAEEAEPLYQEGVTLYQSLSEEFPAVLAYQFYLAMAMHAHGDVLRDLGRLGDSRQVLEQGIRRQQTYLTSQPETRFGRSVLARQHESLAETLSQLGEDQEAARAAREAEQIRADFESRYQGRRRRQEP